VKFSALAIATAAAFVSTASVAAPSKPAPAEHGHYLVVFKSDTLPADAAARIKNAGGTLRRGFDQVGVATVTGGPGFLSAMAKDTKVLSVGKEHLFAAPNTVTREVS
jgi:hypothetical protein